jgi:hypothetical protein
VSSTTAGKTTNVPFTIAHEGSNALFSVVEGSGSFEEIGIGSKAIVCAETGTTWKCFSGSYGQTLGASLSALTDLYGSKAALTTLKADESSSSDVTQSSKTVAGQNVSCWTFHAASNGGVYTDCVTSNGVLAEEYGQSATTKFQVVISKFSTTVPSSEFTPPATPTSTPG